ncbi:MAG: uridine kinase [Bacteroidales bacterium]|nr:uridine kinase [Bacteroidales bacterium]
MLIIGIAGGTGSGKTTVVKKIIEKLPVKSVAVLSQDAYYKDNGHLSMEERQKINFDHPDSLEFGLLEKHIMQIRKGEVIQQPIYSYLTCTRAKETIPVEPKKVVIVEGILILTQSFIRNLFDIKVFVHADADDRLNRVIRRDIVERGRSVDIVLDRYELTVKPMHEQFIEPSKRYADIIVPQGGKNKVAIEILTRYIEQKLNS